MKRVFLSFRVEDRQRVNGLRLLAANSNFDIEFYDELVRKPYDSLDAAYIKSKIREKISRASVTVVLLSEETHTSKWVNWEIEESLTQGNAIICMGFPNGPDRLIVPKAAHDQGIGWKKWDLDTLQELIDNA